MPRPVKIPATVPSTDKLRDTQGSDLAHGAGTPAWMAQRLGVSTKVPIATANGSPVEGTN